MRVMFHNIPFCRSYLISNGIKTYDSGYDFCASKGMGLAVWDTPEKYEDMKYMATTVKQQDLYTALSNDNAQECDTSTNPNDCDGKLVWRQTRGGSCELFSAFSGFSGYAG